MKIAVNLLYLKTDVKSGIGKHIEDILIGFEKLGVLDEVYLIVQESFSEQYLNPINREKPFKNVHAVICHEGRLAKLLIIRLKWGQEFIRELYLNHIVMPSCLNGIKPDVVFNPFNSSANAIFRRYTTLNVIHDLLYKNFPNKKSNLLSKLYPYYLDFKHKEFLYKPKVVVAISEFVKRDILKRFPGINAAKIVVISNAVGVSEELEPAFERGPAFDTDGPFILCVNDHGLHKNHITLLKAYHIVEKSIPHQLILLGGKREETSRILKFIEDNSLDHRVMLLHNISDGERNWLYKNSALVVSPSLHEGFGRTPIEAAMLGAMVLTSTETSLPEVTLGLLNYYEPAKDEKVLADKILELLSNPISLDERERIAKVLKEQYDSLRIAQAYYDLFKKIV